MCGIVGFTGNRQVAPILLDGLSKLEYRGYDSAGLAVRDGENLAQVVKAKGRLSFSCKSNDSTHRFCPSFYSFFYDTFPLTQNDSGHCQSRH